MPTIEVNGKSYGTDEEGYLVNLGEWNEDLAAEIAKAENIEMNENHWEVVNFLRKYYEEYQIAPAVRVLTKAIGKTLGPERATASTCTSFFPTVRPSRRARSPACRSRPVAYNERANEYRTGLFACCRRWPRYPKPIGDDSDV